MQRSMAVAVSATFLMIGSVTRGGDKPELPDRVYFGVGQRIYAFDHAFATSADCDELHVSQAVFPGGGVARGFAFSAAPSAVEMVYLGTTPAEIQRATGRGLDEVRIWAPIVTHRFCRSDQGIVIDQETPFDHVIYRFPSDHSIVGIEVNGRVGPIGSRWIDGATYGQALAGLQWAAAEIDKRFAWPEPAPSSAGCAWPCMKCAGLGMGLLPGGTATLVVGCGAAAPTLGGSCVAAAVAYSAGVATVIDACLECSECLGKNKGGTKKGGTSGIGDCPQGFHPCCNVGVCCNDVNPPACCTPSCD
jgi:hypothetical protein